MRRLVDKGLRQVGFARSEKSENSCTVFLHRVLPALHALAVMAWWRGRMPLGFVVESPPRLFALASGPLVAFCSGDGSKCPCAAVLVYTDSDCAMTCVRLLGGSAWLLCCSALLLHGPFVDPGVQLKWYQVVVWLGLPCAH